MLMQKGLPIIPKIMLEPTQEVALADLCFEVRGYIVEEATSNAP